MSQPAKANAANPKLAENLAKADKYLARFRGKCLPHFVAGEHDPGRSGQGFEDLTPVDNSTLCEVARGNAADIDAAAQAAKRAFPAWRDLPGDERKRLLHRVADLIEAREEEIAIVESMDTGQPIRYMAKAAVRAAENFRFFADRAPSARD